MPCERGFDPPPPVGSSTRTLLACRFKGSTLLIVLSVSSISVSYGTFG